MKSIIIGSSNIERFYKHLDDEKERIIVKKCTRIETFKVLMDDLETDDTQVIMSVIENFLCDSIGIQTEKKIVEDRFNLTMREFLDVVKKTAERLPATKFVMVEPMSRPAVGWYTEGLTEIAKEYSARLAGLDLINISLIKRDDLPSQFFELDGVHLTVAAGKKFLKAIIYYAEEIFEATVVDLERETTGAVDQAMEIEATNPDVLLLASGVGENAEKTTEQKLKEVIEDLEKSRVNDDMMFARIREELDYIANTKKEDRIMITGMSTTMPKPAGQVEARGWIRAVAEANLEPILKGTKDMIQFVSANRSAVPTCEIKLKIGKWL